jgi:hypothetical protein
LAVAERMRSRLENCQVGAWMIIAIGNLSMLGSERKRLTRATGTSWPGCGDVRRHQHPRHACVGRVLRAIQGRSVPVRVIIGQYLGFTAILAVSVLGALGASLLPDTAIPYLGLFPCFSAFVPLGMYGVPATIPAVIPKPRRSPVPVPGRLRP